MTKTPDLFLVLEGQVTINIRRSQCADIEAERWFWPNTCFSPTSMFVNKSYIIWNNICCSIMALIFPFVCLLNYKNICAFIILSTLYIYFVARYEAPNDKCQNMIL